jgi:hypothetical protein
MTDPQMVVLHVSTGHVLAAVAAGARTPTVEDLTGDAFLAVRLQDGSIVRVTADLLTATTVARDNDVLTRPTSFRVDDGVPPISQVGRPKSLASAGSLGAAGDECVSLWQAGDQLEVVREPLDANGAPSPATAAPPGATHRLILCKGNPLVYET